MRIQHPEHEICFLAKQLPRAQVRADELVIWFCSSIFCIIGCVGRGFFALLAFGFSRLRRLFAKLQLFGGLLCLGNMHTASLHVFHTNALTWTVCDRAVYVAGSRRHLSSAAWVILSIPSITMHVRIMLPKCEKFWNPNSYCCLDRAYVQ